MAKCSECKTADSTIRAMIQGTYYPNLCADCKALLSAGQSISSGHARWSRTVDTEDHSFDIIQPYGADGKPNADFIKTYPQQSSAIFSEKEMSDAVRRNL
jgi:hypothetical protein